MRLINGVIAAVRWWRGGGIRASADDTSLLRQYGAGHAAGCCRHDPTDCRRLSAWPCRARWLRRRCRPTTACHRCCKFLDLPALQLYSPDVYHQWRI